MTYVITPARLKVLQKMDRRAREWRASLSEQELKQINKANTKQIRGFWDSLSLEEKKIIGQKGGATRTIHGYSSHPLYRPLYLKWWRMIYRCYHPDDNRYKAYGGRGIRVCKEWRNDLVAFMKWGIVNGWEPGLELDRIDVNLDIILHQIVGL